MQTEQLISQLFDGQHLNQEQIQQLFHYIIQGQLSNEQLAGVLIALKFRGEQADEISGAVKAIIANAKPFPFIDYPFADIVGTGGDNANTINISTTAAIVAATLGYKVAKHGNRSVSSKSGASDVLNALGIKIDLSAEKSKQALDNLNLCFLWAQQYHLGFKHVAPVRQILKTRTIFNILGPLCNPARPKHQLLGVYTPHLLKIYAESALRLGHQHSIVIHGSGLDEVAIHGKTDVAEICHGKIEYYSLTPHDFGFTPKPLETLRGGTAEENAEILTALLQGKGKDEHNQAVAMNVALLMKLFGNDDLKANAEKALNIMANGEAFETLNQLKTYQ
ncbi:anthranilate phosphoribosyltransferase [Histophilus somni]|uniref:Anthranilate phosphoribosyltransferase n=1 Tax=Histophilus somni TaxID=731 RepID=A0AAX2S4F7_HISSO|nr:anthranilate phosphoribosyltransferase [Histophilus somni]QEH08805.1 anthranilate phosphoribosyltransferase [Histophilus somni]QEH12614.1 anthranilate phosphoribosyltransferase [Histophilus somni]QEH17882.1 anthranilate phosphoribosyltransferase [Histophilus somni]QEH25076.1 anthranilate phosphoribosyltransferase [Histophilus somni]QEH27097.1 anthranilate phosphoribosyltransferase [Histophilus somni]